MALADILGRGVKGVKSNAPEILTAFGIGGVITTSYLSAKAAIKAAKMIEDNEKIGGVSDNPKQRFKERLKLTWPVYVPPVISGAVTVACIVGCQRANSRRTAAAVTVYTLTEQAFSKYRDKVIDEIGNTKEQKIVDHLAQERVTSVPPCTKEILMLDDGEVLCCEMLTMRYFKSSIEMLRQARNDVNAMVNHELHVALDEFYDIVGLPHTSQSDLLGWSADRLMELEFSTTLTPDGKPCLAFDYNYVKPLREP